MRGKIFFIALASSMLISLTPIAPVTEVHAAAPEVEIQIAKVAKVKTFMDVPSSNQYYTEIMKMTELGIISGYEDRTFKPKETITRKHAAALVSRAKGNRLPQTHKFVKFKDVNESNPNFGDIKKLQMAGLFAPDSKGNFNPNKPLTRAEMAKILAVAFDLEVKANYDFPDVPVSHPANKYVRALYSNGITKGDNGKFLPNDSLTRGHYSAFMYRAMYMDKNFEAEPIEPGKPTPPVTNPDQKPETPKPGEGSGLGLITGNYKTAFDVPNHLGISTKSSKNSSQRNTMKQE